MKDLQPYVDHMNAKYEALQAELAKGEDGESVALKQACDELTSAFKDYDDGMKTAKRNMPSTTASKGKAKEKAKPKAKSKTRAGL